MVITLPVGTIALLRVFGSFVAWIYSVLCCMIILFIYSVIFQGHRLSTTEPGWAAVDALWAGLVIGTAVWGLTFTMAKLISWLTRHVS